MKTAAEFLKEKCINIQKGEHIIGAITEKELIEFAQEACQEQREICAESAEVHYPASNNLNPTVDRESIKNAPEPKMI